MGRLIYSMSVSLDGFVETPEHSIDWVIVDEELHTFWNDQARAVGAELYGRRLYELMSGYWPTADADPAAPAVIVDYARIWRAKPKVVFSRTLDRVDWNSRLAGPDIAAEVAALKAQDDRDLGVGGPTLAGALIERGLVDEFGLFVNPVVLEAGTPFFPPLDRPLNLALVETRTFSSGVVYLRYKLQPAVGVEAAEPQ